MRATSVVPEALLRNLSPRRSIAGSATAPSEASAKRLLALRASAAS